MHAESALRFKKEAMAYLSLQSKLDGIISRVQCAASDQQFALQLAGLTRALEQNNKGMDVISVSKIMDRFSMCMENLDVAESTVSETMEKVISSTIPQSEVDDLIRQVAEEEALEVATLLPDLTPSVIIATPNVAKPVAAAARPIQTNILGT